MLRRLMLEKGTTPPFVVRLVRRVKYYSFLTYVFAFAYMYFMVCQPLFGYTNVSENAWLPGVVIERFDKHASIPKFTNGLEKAYKERNARTYVMNSLDALGLEVYNQSFQLKTPYLKEYGENIFAILRTEKNPSVEAMLMVIPFDQKHLMGSVLALTMADYFKNQIYWARDIIFLFAHPSATGVEAWLAAYHGHQIPNLHASSLDGRSGFIMGGFVFDYVGKQFSSVTLKSSSVNGRQPNLDLLNIVTRISRKLRFPSIYNGIVPIDFRRGHPTHLEQLQSFVQNIYTQTFVEIDGLHSIFGSYGISVVSIIGNPAPNGKNNVKIGDMAPFIEACFRSLNNLNEKMHDSWFLYYLLFADKFVTFSMFEPFVAFLIFIMGFCALHEYFCINHFVIPKVFIYNHLLSLGLYFVTRFMFSSHLLEDSIRGQAVILLGGPLALYMSTFLHSIDSAAECTITRFALFMEVGFLVGTTSFLSGSPAIIIGVLLPFLMITQIISSKTIVSMTLAFLFHPLIILFIGQFMLAYLEVPSHLDLKMDLNLFQTASKWLLQGILNCLHRHLIHSSMLFPLYSIFLLGISANFSSIAQFPKVLLPQPTFLEANEMKLKTE